MAKLLVWSRDKCVFCGGCVAVCPHDALILHSKELEILSGKCVGCGICVKGCPISALVLEA